MSGLRAISNRQAEALAEFRSSEEARLLARLSQTQCLLEVAKLSSQRVDLVGYAGTAVGIISQFVPSIACILSVEVDDVPPLLTSYGKFTGTPPSWSRHVLRVENKDAGELVVVAEVPTTDTEGFLASIADQISSGISILVEDERLRRRAAVTETFQLVDAIGDEPTAEALSALVQAMALLPHSLGARLEIDHSSLSGALILEAGAPLVEPGVSMNIPGGSFTLGVRWSEARSSQEPSGIGEIVEMLASALTKAEERRKLRDEAETDPLTGIGNRRRALRALSEAINHAEYADDCLSIFYLDLDFFKKVNDDLGHEVGDEVLVRFAQHLQVSVGERDTVARFGGEEFLVVCPGLSQSTAVALLRFLVESTPAACAGALPVGWKQTASAGLACYPAAATHPDALIRCADQALYTAKSSGRNQFKVAGTSSTPTGRR